MINRRNIRIKAFQTIYELGQAYDDVTPEQAANELNKKFNGTSALLGSVTHLLYLICEYVLIYANQKASKHITTASDLNVNTKLAGNIIIQQLKKNNSFSEIVKQYKIAGLFDDELIKKQFLLLLESSEYQNYIASDERNATQEKSILLFILDKCIFHNELAISFLSGVYLSWYNDAEMIESWMDKILQNAGSFYFSKLISGEKLEFAQDLVLNYYTKYDVILKLIEPKLVNWDADRVAQIDLILLHLGISEMLYFKTIPVKVTINEYIDLAKTYSTLQSGQFVNGLLDNVHKELAQQNRLNKESFTRK